MWRTKRGSRSRVTPKFLVIPLNDNGELRRDNSLGKEFNLKYKE